ncbi:transmembrane protease serine 2-like [Aphidius gifuensis]|uniref:transmembrane protease serine 2-like n=1 Tax=Aphidius gifuensis TaxID=684658 RepID=UPI001CDD7E5D|nr:transmembrane protease serine 2-like [Aphidius gifuensis]
MNEHVCCGSIISPTHIVTTASCVTSADKSIIYGNLQVLSGSNNQNYQQGHGNINDVATVIIHPDYLPRQFWANDISILKLSKQLIFSPICRQVILPPPSTSHQYNKLRLISYEQFQTGQLISQLYVKLSSRSVCSDLCREYGRIHPAQHCIKTQYERQTIDNGDSGSPIVTFQKGHLFGIVSLVFIDPHNPAVITKVLMHYVDWIFQAISKY